MHIDQPMDLNYPFNLRDSMYYYYRLEGHTPVPCLNEAEHLQSFCEDAHVADTYLGDGLYRVSTVFLHTDHNFIGMGAPLLFETMVFTDADTGWHNAQWRYSTWDEAAHGHHVVCAAIAQGGSPLGVCLTPDNQEMDSPI